MKFHPGQLRVAGSINGVIGSLDLFRKFKLGHESARFTAEWVFEESLETDIDTYKRIIPGNFASLSFHGISNQMKDFANLAHPRKELREHARKRILQTVEVAGILGATHVVFHQWYSPENIEEFTEDNWYIQADYWPEIGDEASKRGVMIVLENDQTPTPEHAMKLLDKIGHSSVQGHIDIAHALNSSKASPEEWIKTMGDRVHYIHINNTDGENDNHFHLHEGVIDYGKIFPLLEPIWDQLVVTIEADANDREGLKGSIKVLSDLGLMP